MSVLAGRRISNHSFKSPGYLRRFFIFRISSLLILFALAIILGGCARQVHKSPQQIPHLTTEPHIKVCVAENFPQTTLAFEGEYILRSEEAIYYFDSSLGELTVTARGGSVVLANDKRFFSIASGTEFMFRPSDPAATFIWGKTAYAGNLIIQNGSNYHCAINVLPLETYLRGVVPFEIPSGQEEYRQAVYAQTIAARTYALYRMANPSGKSFHVYADTRDQVYNGLKKTTPLADEAIEKTSGVALLLNEKPAFTQYHSTCGGVLQDTTPSFRRDLVEARYNCALSPLFRWVEIRSAETIFANIAKEFNLGQRLREELLISGLQMEISIAGRNAAGRVTSVEMKIPDRTFTARAYRVRQVLANENGHPLPSNMFFILKPFEKEEKFYIIGAGYGHGRGMCQWGALGMSLEGHSYQKILEFYYPSYNLKTIYSKQKWLFESKISPFFKGG